MSNEYLGFPTTATPSNERFFFTNYACCIPTEQYTWMIIVLFLTTVVVFFFCMLATATIKWMYKRRMRKRLQEWKKKYLQDQIKSREFDVKLHDMAQKSKIAVQNPQEVSLWRIADIPNIHVDPAPKQVVEKKKKPSSFQQKPSLGHVNPKAPVAKHSDDTPMAQSSLASQSNKKIPKIPEPPPLTSSAPHPNPESFLQKHDKGSEEYDNLTQPTEVFTAKLAPPPTSTTTDFSSGTTAPTTGSSGSVEPTAEVATGSTNVTSSVPATSSSFSPKDAKTQSPSPGDSLQPKVRGPLVTEDEEEDVRKEAAGEQRKRRRCAPPSSITSTTQRTRSWLFDSTGSYRFDAGRDVTSRSSSLLKTDSSQYKTASIDRYPHGAFSFPH